MIVVPPSLLFNWHNEIETFYPALKIYEYVGAQRAMVFDTADIVITTYDIVRRDIEQLKKVQFHVIIFDEAQVLKNVSSERTGAARALQGLFRICLTGTPLENHVGEYYSIMDLAIPGLLPDYRTFCARVKADDYVPLIQRTRPFILRRTKDTVLQDLPPRIESTVYLDMVAQQKALYAKAILEIKRHVDSAYNTKTSAQAGVIALTAILRLRQMCISPLLVQVGTALNSPKIEYLIEKLTELTAEGHAALVFSQFTTCLDLLEAHLNKHGISLLRIDGSTPMAKRKAIVEAFQRQSGAAILLLSLKTGGVGLNLTRASYVFHIDPWWNPAVENQASDRAHRLGQTKSVMIHRLIMRHSIEEKIMVLKEKKRAVFDSVIEGSSTQNKQSVTREDFDFLLS